MAPSLSSTMALPPRVAGVGKTTFTNPVVSGFAPDPSAVFVEGTCYLVTSSFHMFPGIPIYASQDLQGWKHIGHVINRPDQLDMSQNTTHSFPLDTGHTMVASGGLWAPTIRHHKGRFYVVCTNCVRGGSGHFKYENFYVWTDDIFSGKWSDPIYVDFHGIDPSLFFDDDNRVYLQAAWELTRVEQPSCVIKQVEIDISTGKYLSELKDIWSGAAQYDTEGPHVYKKDDYYYLLVAEGGTFENHMLSIGRSRNIWGPYESFKHNPIMTSKGKNEYIQNIGHGELFEDDSGAWWAVVLGVRDVADTGSPMGRETFLTPVEWPAGEWPTVLQPRITFSRVTSVRDHDVSTKKRLGTAAQDNRIEDLFIRNACATDYSFPSSNAIVLKAREANLSTESGTVTFLGHRQRHIDFVAHVRLEVKDLDGIKAGLAIYKDDQRHLGIYYDERSQSIQVEVMNKSKSPQTVTRTADQTIESSAVCFQIRGCAKTYDLSFRQDRQDSWTQLYSTSTSTMVARDFTGTVIGVTASACGAAIGQEVWFGEFEILPTVRPLLY
ncbi:Hypothetical protein D9617_21g097810 [Elsinoe fawcettii]|nr:Hypothetical protein D9617_21g097810 [Elsinoe fawcettii]